MKHRLFSLALALSLVLLVHAGDLEESQRVMKAMKTINDSLRKNLEAKAADALAADARKMVDLFAETETFWAHKNAPDAVKFAQNGKAAAGELASAAANRNLDAAGAAAKKMGGSCQSCHNQYREKAPDGSYRIKGI